MGPTCDTGAPPAAALAATPPWPPSVSCNSPPLLQMRARPSDEPVASCVPFGAQSSVVTSLPRASSCGTLWRNTTDLTPADALAELAGASGTDHMRPVASPLPEARREAVGDHAQMNTSDECPARCKISSSETSTPPLSPPPCALRAPPPPPPTPMLLPRACAASPISPSTSMEPFPSAPPPLARSRLTTERAGAVLSRESGSSYKTSSPLASTACSSSVYCSPFWRKETRAPGGTLAVFTFDLAMFASMPNVNAVCWKPDSCK
mmetsp:Transcript_6272/g.19629  ORF Transcript_6272/g.19629 Transcript_6272/m.19629 type:complete len:264 (-) Transcript_6272:138-929(-)